MQLNKNPHYDIKIKSKEEIFVWIISEIWFQLHVMSWK